MRAQLIVGSVEVAFDGGVLDRTVLNSLDLTIRPWMLLGFVSLWSTSLVAQAYSKACGLGRASALAIIFLISTGDQESPAGSVKWVPLSVSDRVDLVRDGLDQSTQETRECRAAKTVSRSSDKGELRGPVDGDKEIELALGGSGTSAMSIWK